MGWAIGGSAFVCVGWCKRVRRTYRWMNKLLAVLQQIASSILEFTINLVYIKSETSENAYTDKNVHN